MAVKQRMIGKIGCSVCNQAFGVWGKTLLITKTEKCITGRCQRCDTRIFVKDPEAVEYFEGVREAELQAAYDRGASDASMAAQGSIRDAREIGKLAGIEAALKAQR